MTDLTPYIFISCPSCAESGEAPNCYEMADVRWSRVMPGSTAEPQPVCEGCWDEADHVPCAWSDLDPVSLVSPETVTVPRELLRRVLEDASYNVHMAAITERARIAELRKAAGLGVEDD